MKRTSISSTPTAAAGFSDQRLNVYVICPGPLKEPLTLQRTVWCFNRLYNIENAVNEDAAPVGLGNRIFIIILFNDTSPSIYSYLYKVVWRWWPGLAYVNMNVLGEDLSVRAYACVNMPALSQCSGPVDWWLYRTQINHRLITVR